MAARTADHQSATRIMLRPLASPLPLGFFAFAIGMLLIGMLAIGVVPPSETKQLGVVLVTFVFPLELIATIFTFLARDTMGATTLGLFTASWLAFGTTDILSVPGVKSLVLGIYLFGFAGAVLLISILSVKAKPFFTALLLVAFARMLFNGIYEVGGSMVFFRISGYVALILSALAFYGAVAFAIEDAGQQEILPLFRRGKAHAAFEGFQEQIGRLEAEPGVRQQL
jgi:succinate-acetate transporter protein